MPLRMEKVVVVGVGLIGGSFALALRAAGAARRLVGIGRTEKTLREALDLRVVDEAGSSFATVAGADLVLLAVPVGQSRAALEAMAPHLSPHTIVTDAGSTKSDVVLAARAALPAGALSRFVPGHPIAGTEHSGPAAAFAELFQNRNVVLTPVAETDAAALATVRAAWLACGARVFEIAPEAHDRIFAAVSHLPHLLAFALVGQVANDPDAARLFSYAAGGFRDFTRIASSHPEMWRDICIANRGALLAELGRFQQELAALRSALQGSDGAALQAMFERARNARNRWIEQSRPEAADGARDRSC